MAPFYTPESRRALHGVNSGGRGCGRGGRASRRRARRPSGARARNGRVQVGRVYAGREVLVDVDGVDARSAAGTATGSRLPSSRGRSRSACIVNGRLRQTGEGAVRPAPPCSTHTSPRTTRSWPPCWRRNEPDTAAYRAHAGLERPGPLGERRARGRRLHCFVLANDVDTEAFAFTTRPRTHFKRAAARKGIPKVPRFAGPSWPAGYSRWHSVRENTNRLHVVPRHTTLKLCCTNSCSLNARPRHHRAAHTSGSASSVRAMSVSSTRTTSSFIPAPLPRRLPGLPPRPTPRSARSRSSAPGRARRGVRRRPSRR